MQSASVLYNQIIKFAGQPSDVSHVGRRLHALSWCLGIAKEFGHGAASGLDHVISDVGRVHKSHGAGSLIDGLDTYLQAVAPQLLELNKNRNDIAGLTKTAMSAPVNSFGALDQRGVTLTNQGAGKPVCKDHTPRWKLIEEQKYIGGKVV